MKKILFTGGGSAGHVIPNLALIEDLKGLDVDFAYMGTNGIERTLAHELHIPFYTISCPKLRRGLTLENLKNNLQIPFQLYRAKKEALRGLEIIHPDVVFSKGGYVALPVLLASKKLGIPCFAHESDFSPGLTTKLTARLCKTVFTSFPETTKKLPHGKYSGAPLRRQLFHANRENARAEFALSESQKAILVLGGGSGSKLLNDAIRQALKVLPKNYMIFHVCGRGNRVDCNFKNYRQFEFIKDMGSLYALSDLVISRAGSGATFEILALKKPSILIPLERASRGDQVENANYFLKRGLCHVLHEDQLASLPTAIEKAFADSQMRKKLDESKFSSGNANILKVLLGNL